MQNLKQTRWFKLSTIFNTGERIQRRVKIEDILVIEYSLEPITTDLRANNNAYVTEITAQELFEWSHIIELFR